MVSVPVTVDSEAGYSSDPAKVADHVMALVEMGVAGINLEDGTESPDGSPWGRASIKSTAKGKGIFINARSDVLSQDLLPDDKKLAEMIRRGKSLSRCRTPMDSSHPA